MAPTIDVGDRVLVAPAAPESLKPGDIVKFRAQGAFVMHRLVRFDRGEDGARAFVFRGDNAPANDQPVTAAAIIGRAVAVERHGVQRRLDSRFELWRGRLKIIKRALIERWRDRRGGALVLIPALAALLSLGSSTAFAHSHDYRSDDSRDSRDSRDDRDDRDDRYDRDDRGKNSNGKTPALATLSVIGTPRVGRHPFGVAIDSGHGLAVVANRNDRTVSVIDLLSATTVRTILVGRGPVEVAIARAASRS